MPDITMCNNHQCPQAKQCYRHEAKPSEWQSMATFKYKVSGKGVFCEDFESIYSTYQSGGAT